MQKQVIASIMCKNGGNKMSVKRLLNIPKGYKITNLKTVEDAIEVDIEVYKNKKAICSGCGEEHSKGYHGKVIVQVRDLPVCGQKVYLNVSKRRYRCPKDNKIYVEEIEWIKKKEEVPIDLLKMFTV